MVLKFGGSSLRGLGQWRSVAARVEERRAEGYRVLLVCSAIQGVTDLLQRLSREPGDAALRAQIIRRHEVFAGELGVEAATWLAEAMALLETACTELQRATSPSGVAALLAMGEWLSTRIGNSFLERHFNVEWIDARELLEAQVEAGLSAPRQWLSARCAAGRDDALSARLDGLAPVVITQGFVARMPKGGTALLGRGGSDTSAALLGGRIGAERVEIWTDVPGMFSADPRCIPQARLLRALDYAEALEMAASGASVVHARCIRAAAETNLPLWIMDTSRPEIGGTQIDGDSKPRHAGVKAVICQPAMAVLLLENIDPRQQVGFLAWVFGVFTRRGISIDLVATSETTTTVALNREGNHLDRGDLDSLARALQERCKVRLFDDCVCVNLVGRGVRTALARMAAAFSCFEDKPLLMVSQSANDLCLSLLVRRGDETAVLTAAHGALISAGETGDVFGPSWLELERGEAGTAAGGGRL